jgi:hypothetical protein
MNAYLFSAGIVSLFMAGGHTAIGVLWVLPRLSEESLPRSPFGGGAMTLAFLEVTWHAVALMLVALGIILLTLARGHLGDDGAISARAIGALFATATAMVLWRARRRPVDLFRAPMWLLFVAMSVLCLLGASG